MILKAKRDREYDEKYFIAALNGVDLDKNSKSAAQQKIEEVKRRAAVKELGESEVQREEFAVIGFGYETE